MEKQEYNLGEISQVVFPLKYPSRWLVFPQVWIFNLEPPVCRSSHPALAATLNRFLF